MRHHLTLSLFKVAPTWPDGRSVVLILTGTTSLTVYSTCTAVGTLLFARGVAVGGTDGEWLLSYRLVFTRDCPYH